MGSSGGCCPFSFRLAIAAAIVCASASAALARPGGGGHYSGGGGHSYSGGGGHYAGGHYAGHGGGDPTVALVVLLLVLIGWLIWKAITYVDHGANERVAGAYEPTAQPLLAADVEAPIRGHDPRFDRAAFAERTLAVMKRVNDAWCAGDMGPARALVSDGVFVRFQTYLRLYTAAGKRNVMSDWSPLRASVVAARSDAHWDTVLVAIRAQARDVDVPIALDHAAVERRLRAAPLAPYEEVWSFVRRRGLTTPANVLAGALEGTCAKCGAPLPRSQVVRCGHCQALTNSGEHDWVLAEITQLEELDLGREARDVPGLDAIRADDPEVSRADLEDRASLVFWKWIEARVCGNRRRLERFCAQWGKPAAPPAVLDEVAVGAADAVRAWRDGDHDHVEVEIRWSARWTDGAEPVNQHTRVTITRAAGARSTRGLSCLDCPHCGGELADSDDVTCRYCGAPLAGLAADWALEDVHPSA